jgi:UDP-glucose:(heptosyl)LPS alpha-1,3-glucosyltransferase
MRIAIIRKKYTFHGGSEGFSQDLVSRLAETGHTVHIFAIKWSESSVKNVFFHKVPAVPFTSLLRDLTFAVSTFFMLKKRKGYFDIIQSHDKTLFQNIYRAGDGCHIEWLRQRWKRIGSSGKISIAVNPYHWLILFIERIIFNRHRFHKVIAISNLVKNNIIDNYNVKETDIRVIYNGVDLDRFNPRNRENFRAEIRRKYSIAENDFVALFVGSGFERKGVEFLLSALSHVPDPVTVLIVGKGPAKRFRDAKKIHRVIYCGAQEDVAPYYASADVFLFPAIYEPFGNVHLEALASGLPVITTKLSGASEIISNGQEGFVVDIPEHTGEIAERISQLMKKDVNQRMRIEARKRAESFSFEEHLKHIIGLYSTVTASGK